MMDYYDTIYCNATNIKCDFCQKPVGKEAIQVHGMGTFCNRACEYGYKNDVEQEYESVSIFLED